GITVPLLVLFPLAQHEPSPGSAASSTRVSGEGLSIDLRDGWDGRIFYNPDAGERVLQFANLPLDPVPPAGPEDDLASRTRGGMGPGDVVVVLRELTYCPCAGFEHRDLPVSVTPIGGGGGIEGVDPTHAFGRVRFENGGRYFDLLA